ncbi:hypothetical protein LIA77_08468 [Sarocladium implicatum]|nr:hypothetical protein LIA77_08468 [Sarocladium implicatum]
MQRVFWSQEIPSIRVCEPPSCLQGTRKCYSVVQFAMWIMPPGKGGQQHHQIQAQSPDSRYSVRKEDQHELGQSPRQMTANGSHPLLHHHQHGSSISNVQTPPTRDLWKPWNPWERCQRWPTSTHVTFGETATALYLIQLADSRLTRSASPHRELDSPTALTVLHHSLLHSSNGSAAAATRIHLDWDSIQFQSEGRADVFAASSQVWLSFHPQAYLNIASCQAGERHSINSKLMSCYASDETLGSISGLPSMVYVHRETHLGERNWWSLGRKPTKLAMQVLNRPRISQCRQTPSSNSETASRQQDLDVMSASLQRLSSSKLR